MAREEEGFFDDLARGLADGSVTRSKALRLMGAAVVGSALGSVGIGGEASADPPGCKRNGKACKKNTQCCSGNCVNAPTGTCVACPSGQVLCNGNCVSNSCLANSGQVFNSSTCQCECPSGRVLLSNGTCALACGAGLPDCPNCSGNGFPSCDTEAGTGRTFCEGETAGTCTTTNDCPTGQICTGGVCFVAC